MASKDSFTDLSETAIIAKIREAEERALAAEREAKGWQMILEGRRMLTGQRGTPLDTTGKPGLTEAIERVMLTDPARNWPAGEIWNVLVDNDWIPDSTNPRNAFFATLSSMDGRKIERVDRGTYRLLLRALGEHQQQLLDAEGG